MNLKLPLLSFLLGCGFLFAHEDPSDVIHALTHKLEHAKESEKAELYLKRATEYRASGQSAKAKADLLIYTKLKSTDYLGWLELGKIEGEGRNRLVYLTKSLGLAKTDREKVMSYFELAVHFYAEKNYQTALESCENAIQIGNKKELTPLLLKSHLLWQLGKLEKRVVFLTEAKKINQSVVLENNWIEAMIDAGKGDDLEDLIERGMQASRLKSSWQIRAALCATKHSDEAKALANLAITEIKQRLDMKRPDLTLLMDLSRAYSINEEYDKAQQFLKLIKGSPHDPWVIYELEKKIQAPKNASNE